MAEKIAVIKTGWSEDYRGSVIEAAHAYVGEFEDGHEKFNFLPGPDGRYYAYTPPIGEKFSPPKPRERDRWLVFAVAKPPKRSGLHVVGWYEDASFTGQYLARPEYGSRASTMALDGQGQQFSYTVEADRAVSIPYEERTFSFRGDRLKRAPVFYLRGNGDKEDWREELADFLLSVRREFGSPATTQTIAAAASSGGICADASRRKEVEEAAIQRVMAEFPNSDFEIIDKQMDKCGFDLLVKCRDSSELHIEVKGTAMPHPHFLMSRNEYGYMRANPTNWRLAMVTDALGSPTLELLDSREAGRRFLWEEFTWRAIGKSK